MVMREEDDTYCSINLYSRTYYIQGMSNDSLREIEERGQSYKGRQMQFVKVGFKMVLLGHWSGRGTSHDLSLGHFEGARLLSAICQHMM